MLKIVLIIAGVIVAGFILWAIGAVIVAGSKNRQP
jgi:hypothetical protein